MTIYDIFTGVVLGGLIVLGVMAVAASRRAAGQHNRSGEELWRELRRAHGLTRRQVRWLRRAAEQTALDPPTLVFVQPHVLARLADDESAANRAAIQELIARLHS